MPIAVRRIIIFSTALIMSFAIFFAGSTHPSNAEPSLEETKKLLQKGLTLYEIDQEIERLTKQEKRISEDIAANEAGLVLQEQKVEDTRVHAGKVLRAYYMGERDNLWSMLFSAKSFSEALTVYDYLNMIISNDHRSLNAYASSMKELKDAHQKLEDTRTELQSVKESFLAQREKVVAVQKEIDEQLKASAEAKELKEQMDRFTDEWKNKGVPLFRTYLSAISTAMQSLPELLTGENGDKYMKNMSFTKKTAEFEIGESDLNDFFRSKNPLFEKLSFHFQEGKFIVNGKEEDMEVSITGHYTVELEPVNKLQFHVDQLTFNGFVLPDTSNLALEQEFDLGFTPQKYVKNLTVTDVALQDGKLNFKLKL